MLAALLLCIVPIAVTAAGSSKTIRLLTIGNSFAENSTSMLPEIAESRGRTVVVGKANLGGSGLERHARYLLANLDDPDASEGRPYRVSRDRNSRHYSLIEALQSDDWDFVTLQQFSGDSYKWSTYEPYSAQLVEIIRRIAPRAQPIVLESWAYRDDHPIFIANPPEQRSEYERQLAARSTGAFEPDPGLTREKMYAGLHDAYTRLARRYGLRVIPVGTAFHEARALPRWSFHHPDPGFDYVHPVDGQLPDQRGSLVGGWFWRASPQGGPRTLALDAKHGNLAGRYLGACVIYATLTGEDAREISWVPAGLDPEDARMLRDVAQSAVDKNEFR